MPSADKFPHIEELERALHRLAEAERRLRQAAAAELGIGGSDLDALLLLDASGGLAAGRIAEALGITTGAVTGLVDRLERAGWVQRARHASDRRQVVVELAPGRRTAIDAHRALRERLLEAALATTDRATRAGLLAALGSAADGLMRGAEGLLRSGSADAPASEDGTRAPMGDIHEARLRFLSGVPRLALRSATMRDLYRASFRGRAPRVQVSADGTVTFRYEGLPWLSGRRSGLELTLTRAVPWTIEIRGGVAELSADLRDLDLRGIDIKGGASRCELSLPAPTGSAVLRVKGGANHVVVRRPPGVEARAVVRGGANSLVFDDQRIGALGSTARFATPGWEGARDRWSLELTGGASDLSVVEEA